MTAHTPGPWHWDGQIWAKYDQELEAPWLVSENGKAVLLGGGIEATEANARLIAAAPLLLEALRDIFDAYNLPENENEYAFKRAKEALDAAGGGKLCIACGGAGSYEEQVTEAGMIQIVRCFRCGGTGRKP